MQISRRNLIGAAGLAASQTSAQPRQNDFYRRLVAANDRLVPSLNEGAAPPGAIRGIRGTGSQIEALCAAFCAPESSYHGDAALIAPMEKASRRLLDAQHADGTIDSGNLFSPPDTGFVLESVCRALAVLRVVNDRRLDQTRENLSRFILAGGEPLVTGGVHTPNHRWVVCAALARIHSLFPAEKYVRRIDQWLGEGIFIDQDGQFAERSTGIYSAVEDGAFVTLARLLNRPELLEPVRRNLTMNVYYMHPDGEMETVASRRQDAGMVGNISHYYLEYRYLAIRDGNALFSGVAELIESKLAAQVQRMGALTGFLEEPLLQKPLPAPAAVPSRYAKVFAGSGVARVRRDEMSATVFGGSDWPLGVASGLSSNPTFFTFRKGGAVLESVRMACNFFSEGAFRSEGLVVENGAYSLHQRFDVPYYQPLAERDRNARGDYPLTPAADERYWSKMNFPKRPVSNVQTIDQRVFVVEKDGGFELRFEITGHDGVPVTVELAFRAGGTFAGAVREEAEPKTYSLGDGLGRYTVGGDTIEFGPGGGAAHRFLRLEGHTYTAHRGSLRPSGLCVYVTGVTPFRRTLFVR